MIAFLTSLCMLTLSLPSLFPFFVWFLDFCDYLIDSGAAVFLLVNFPSSSLLMYFAHAVLFHVFLQLVLPPALFHFVNILPIFSVWSLLLQSWLFQLCCIFFHFLRSFIMTMFIQTFRWTISYLLMNLKTHLSYLQYHIPFSLIVFLNQSLTYHRSSGLYCLFCSGMMGQMRPFFFFFFFDHFSSDFMGCFSVSVLLAVIL